MTDCETIKRLLDTAEVLVIQNEELIKRLDTLIELIESFSQEELNG